LPNEPRADSDGRQQALTARHLLPALAQLEACLLYLRAELDPVLRERQPVKLGKPYPLGQCLEISKAVQERLAEVREDELPPAARTGLRALRSFERDGGRVRQVWGDLREQYFQNAFQFGTLYVDVSNDTVTATKPKVEILPFEEAGLAAIRDYRHYAARAATYWQETAWPNHVLPALAPHCPLVLVGANGRVQLRAVSDYMLALTRSRAFAPSEAVLQDAPMPLELFEQVRQALRDSGHALPDDPEAGRRQALDACLQARAEGVHQDPAALEHLIHEALALNQTLASRTIRAPSSAPTQDTQPMPSKIRIDDTEHVFEVVPAEVRTLLENIAFVDGESARLQAQLAAMQAARGAYVGQLKALLPKE
jgi:hypothetical protein